MNRNKYLLLVSSVGVLLLLVVAAVQENFLKEWRQIQAGARAEDGPISVQLRQVVNGPLRAADRCVSCHVGMAAGEQGVTGHEVLRVHPPVVHDPAEFGCTVCHAGQGQATVKADAHGDVPFWPEPMIPTRLSEAGCGRCHATLGVPERGQLRRTQATFERLDCLACHRVDGRGGTLRPDGGGMEGPDLSRAGLAGFDPDWYSGHVRQSAAATQGPWKDSFVPLSEADRALLATFLRMRVASPRLIDAKSTFLSSGCLGCHKVSGIGGDDGPDLSRAGSKDPAQASFASVTGPHTIANWQAAHFRAPASVVVGSQMPPVTLADDEIELLTMYVLSLRRSELPDVYLPTDRVRAAKLGDREYAADGATVFGAFCAGCHGRDGLGRRLPGVTSFPSIANPDFLALVSDEFLAATISRGRPGRRMPAWLKAGGLTRQEIDAAVAHLRALGGVTPPADEKPPRWVRADAARGRQVFESTCAGCHGPSGEGGEGPALRNPVLLETATDTFLVETIGRGRRGTVMAGFDTATPVRPALSRDDIEAVVAYLRAPAQQAGGATAPTGR
jgi:cbb3-type cytochrome c oxidase subunit III